MPSPDVEASIRVRRRNNCRFCTGLKISFDVDKKGRRLAGSARCVPGMGIDLEVKVHSELGHRNRSDPQGDDPRGQH